MVERLIVGEIYYIICVIAILFINVFVIYIYDILNKNYKEELEKKLLEQQNNFYAKQLKMMNESQDNIKYLKHDIKNRLISVKAVSGDCKEVNEYINNILELTDISNEYAQSGNVFVDSILNYKLYEAQKKKINNELELKIPSQLNIKPNDMGVILGNLLDNYVSALIVVGFVKAQRRKRIYFFSRKSAERRIKVFLSTIGGGQFDCVYFGK